MHVPVLMMLDNLYEENDIEYDKVRESKRKLLLLISFLLSLFFGAVPMLGWGGPISFEPSGLSCAVYHEKPEMSYITYIIACFFVFEFIPLGIVAFCVSQAKKVPIRVG